MKTFASVVVAFALVAFGTVAFAATKVSNTTILESKETGVICTTTCYGTGNMRTCNTYCY